MYVCVISSSNVFVAEVTREQKFGLERGATASNFNKRLNIVVSNSFVLGLQELL